jgi:hypothetical protein
MGMKIRITSPADYDRHDAELRFVATINGRAASVTITRYALGIAGEALEALPADPLVAYAASGRLLEAVLADIVSAVGAEQSTYLIGHEDVLRVTGRSGEGHSHVPKRWRG